MQELIQRALTAAGYDGMEPTPDNLYECYIDYATAYGQSVEDAQEDIADGTITLGIACRRLIRA